MSQTVITAREGNVFRGVCQSFCVQGGGVGTPIGTDIKWWPPQRSARIVLECILVFFFQMVIVLNGYADSFKDKYTKILRKKMGIENSNRHNDVYLIGTLLQMMEDNKSDFTLTFRQLSDWKLEDIKNITSKNTCGL